MVDEGGPCPRGRVASGCSFHARMSRRWAGVIALHLGVVLAFGVYVTARNTMVARRHGLVLKRLQRDLPVRATARHDRAGARLRRSPGPPRRRRRDRRYAGAGRSAVTGCRRGARGRWSPGPPCSPPRPEAGLAGIDAPDAAFSPVPAARRAGSGESGRDVGPPVSLRARRALLSGAAGPVGRGRFARPPIRLRVGCAPNTGGQDPHAQDGPEVTRRRCVASDQYPTDLAGRRWCRCHLPRRLLAV